MCGTQVDRPSMVSTRVQDGHETPNSFKPGPETPGTCEPTSADSSTSPKAQSPSLPIIGKKLDQLNLPHNAESILLASWRKNSCNAIFIISHPLGTISVVLLMASTSTVVTFLMALSF